MRQIRAVIGDRQSLFVEGFKWILSRLTDVEVSILAEADTAQSLMTTLDETSCDLVFLELNFQDEDGLSIIPKIKNKYPYLKICVMSSYTDHKFVKAAFQNGADAYFSKNNDSEQLKECFESIFSENTFLSKGLHITPPPRSKSNGVSKHLIEDRFLLKQKLTRREHEVLGLITKALNNKEIADQLYISDQTVGVHRKNIMRKLGVRNTVNLIKFAIDHELV